MLAQPAEQCSPAHEVSAGKSWRRRKTGATLSLGGRKRRHPRDTSSPAPQALAACGRVRLIPRCRVGAVLGIRQIRAVPTPQGPLSLPILSNGGQGTPQVREPATTGPFRSTRSRSPNPQPQGIPHVTGIPRTVRQCAPYPLEMMDQDTRHQSRTIRCGQPPAKPPMQRQQGGPKPRSLPKDGQASIPDPSEGGRIHEPLSHSVLHLRTGRWFCSSPTTHPLNGSRGRTVPLLGRTIEGRPK